MITVVVPTFHSVRSLPILVERLEKVLIQMRCSYEVVIVDDCSTDGTWLVLNDLKKNRSWLKIIRLLRNSGQHNALLCGFSIAKGDVIITMDDDLQNPPEEMPKLISKINEGYDLVIGSYQFKRHEKIRNLAGALIDYLQRRIFGLPKDFQLTSFRAVKRQVITNLVAMNVSFPYITSMLLSQTSSCINVSVRHEPRSFGRSNYNFSRSLRLAFNLLLNYSSYPLYFVVTLSLIALSATFGVGAWVLLTAFAEYSSVPGWASTIIAISFFNGLILLALVVQSLYLSRIAQQLSRSRVGFTIGEMRE